MARAERRQRGELAFGTVDSWLMWQLTGAARCTPTEHPGHSNRLARTCSWTDLVLDLSEGALVERREI